MTRVEARTRYLTAKQRLLEAMEDVLRVAGADNELVDHARYQLENNVIVTVMRAEELAADENFDLT